MKCRTLGAFLPLCALALNVHASAPVIHTPPQPITINNASTATFSVVASNAASYQWQLSGTNIPGATNSTYTYDNVTTNQAGEYSVEVTSSSGEATNSQPAQLTILQGTTLQITFSGFPNGSPSNVVVQLFDHDKPSTVANFLHYLTPAVQPGVPPFTNVFFSNMIWSRCLPGFVLQGGSYVAMNRTDTTPLTKPLTQISPISTISQPYVPPFPLSIGNESDVGPRIPNTFGTMAMALQPGNPDSASSGFFFNLTNNSTTLDHQNGGYTVFGRVLSGSNVLQYFNTLSKPNEGIFDQSTISANPFITDLPVNFHGWQVPAVSNLFYADFQLLTSSAADTNPPVVVMTYPTNNQTLTNADLVLQGTASDNVAVTRVICTFLSTNGIGNINAAGTTNWTADFGATFGNLLPGTYTVWVQAQDGAGNISTNGAGPVQQFYVTNVVMPSFFLPPTVIGNGSLSSNLTATNSTFGSTYTITATPGKGAVFVDWDFGTFAYRLPKPTFTLENGVQATANFISNTMPAGRVSFTYPAPNAQLTNATLSIEGKVAGSARIACRVYSASTGISVSSNIVINSSGSWSTPPLSLAPGDYVVQAVATDSNAQTRLILENFTVLAPLTIVKYGAGTVSIPSGAYKRVGSNYIIVATPAGGQSFLSWNAGTGNIAYPKISFTMTAGLTLTATFVSNSLPRKMAFVSPPPGASLSTTNVTLAGKIDSSVSAPQVVCQIFESYTPVTAFMPATVVGGTNWTLTLTNWPMGAYVAVAILTDASGKSELVSEMFNVNYYPMLSGSYHGIFLDTNSISETNAGSLSFTLSHTGALFGSLTFPATSIQFYQPLGSPTGDYDFHVSAFNHTLFLGMHFDFSNFSGTMTGFLTNGAEACPVTAYRDAPNLSTNTVPSTGKYVLNLAPVNPANGNPTGDSFAAVTVAANGSLAVGGTLADATSFSLSTGVGTNGVWPMYAKLDNGKGMLIGWETNLPSGACVGTLYWVKSPVKGSYYPGGVQEELDSSGAMFIPPRPGTNYQIVFGGGSLSNLVADQFSFKASGTSYTMAPATGTTNQLTGTLLSTGVFSKGSIVNPFNHQKLPFSGSFISPSEGGGGFTQDANAQTGFFTITQAP